MQGVLGSEWPPGLLVLDRQVDVLPRGAEPLMYLASWHVERDRAGDLGRIGRRALVDLVRRVGEEDLQRVEQWHGPVETAEAEGLDVPRAHGLAVGAVPVL